MYKSMALAALFLLQATQAETVLNNEFFEVARDSASCAAAAAGCGERVVVALGPLELNGKKMQRGEIQVFLAGKQYAPPASGEYFEVNVKPSHPKVAPPAAGTPPAPGNRVLYDYNDFTVFEEKMEPGELSSAHSHNIRLAIFLNKTKVQQWTNGKEQTRDLVPDTVQFRPAVVHISKDVGSVPIKNLLIEFKP